VGHGRGAMSDELSAAIAGVCGLVVIAWLLWQAPRTKSIAEEERDWWRLRREHRTKKGKS
jgi:hypothetical protein